MNAKLTRLPARFAAPTRFKPRLNAAAVPVRGKAEQDLDSLKERLVREWLEKSEPGLHRRVKRAGNEAATLAWLTPYPLLCLPVLLDEAVGKVRQHATRQQCILRRSRPTLRAA